jgi:fumarate reductase subunit C
MNPVYLRLALYLASTVLGLIPAAFAGFVSFDAATNMLSINVEGLITALFAGSALTSGVFAVWGKK